MSDEPVLYNMVLVSKGTPMNSIPESFEPGCCVVLGLHFCIPGCGLVLFLGGRVVNKLCNSVFRK